MTPLDAFILGLVQGLTEFLPVSSSGHLVIAEQLLGFHRAGLAFEIWLHLATLAAVTTALRRDIGMAVRSLAPRAPEAIRKPGRLLVLCLLVGTLPAALVGFFLGDLVEAGFGSVRLVGVDLLVTALILLSTRWIPEGKAPLTVRRALLVGAAQAVAVLPGVSRSGSTLAAGLATGLPGMEAARFSFLLSVPIILGAVVVELHHLAELGAQAPLALAVGFVASAVSGYFSVGIVWRVMQRRRLALFAPYCAVIGILAILWGGSLPR